MGLDKELGSVEAGRLADLLAVEGNPLEDLTALGRVVLVVKSGAIVLGGR
jgi:imidazolonepropionase-like amidohydrolase